MMGNYCAAPRAGLLITSHWMLAGLLGLVLLGAARVQPLPLHQHSLAFCRSGVRLYCLQCLICEHAHVFSWE